MITQAIYSLFTPSSWIHSEITFLRLPYIWVWSREWVLTSGSYIRAGTGLLSILFLLSVCWNPDEPNLNPAADDIASGSGEITQRRKSGWLSDHTENESTQERKGKSGYKNAGNCMQKISLHWNWGIRCFRFREASGICRVCRRQRERTGEVHWRTCWFWLHFLLNFLWQFNT